MEISKKRIIIKFHLLIILFLLISCGKDTNTNTNIITIGNNITDTQAPQCTVAINNDDSATDSTNVTLSLSATDDTGVTGYYISESSSIPSLTGSGWVLINSTKSYSATVSYSLSSGSGTKMVYVWFRDAAGGTITTILSGLNTPYGIAVDSASVYWSEADGGTVKKMNINGGTVTTFASGVYGYGIAVDSTNVYWTDYYGGTVNKVAK